MNLLISPIVIPLTGALLCLLFHKSIRSQRILTFFSGALQLAFFSWIMKEIYNKDFLVLKVGGWSSEIGIVLVADFFSGIMLLVTSFTAICVLVYSFKEVDEKVQSRFFYPLFNFLLLGVNGSFITGDIFNLFVWFEITLLASFILLTVGRKPEQLEGAIKYVILNLFSSFLFLIGVGLLYAKVGSLNFADISMKIASDADGVLVNTTGILFLVSFGFKAAVFPFFFWLPASYHTPPVAISSLFAALLTKVGVYALIRVFTLLFFYESSFFKGIFGTLAVLTMVIGVLCAASQFEMRKILSVHIVSQIGYMILGLAIFTPLAIAGAIFYVIHNILVKTNLFLISGVIKRIKGHTELSSLGGLYKSYPFLSVLFILSALSLAGLPPFSGFWAKLSVLKASAQSEMYLYLISGLAVGVVTLYSMVKIWNYAFWKKEENEVTVNAESSYNLYMLVPIIAMTLSALILGLGGEYVFSACMNSAEQLMNPQLYIEAVQGGAK